MYQNTSNHAYPPHNLPDGTGYPVSYGGNGTGYPVSYGGNNPPVPPPITSAPPPQIQAMVDWSTGLCDCFSDCNSCCMTFWCPCVTFGRVAEIIGRGSTSCGTSGTLYTLIACLTGCGWIYSCSYRTKMRRQYMLKNSPCCDCLVHFCCESCALCQEYRELKNRGVDMVAGWNNGNIELISRGVGMAPTTPAYQHMTR